MFILHLIYLPHVFGRDISAAPPIPIPRLAVDMKFPIHIHIHIHRFSVDIHGYIHGYIHIHRPACMQPPIFAKYNSARAFISP